MSDTKNKDSVYEFLSSKQEEVASRIEALLIGLTIKEAKELLYAVRKSIEETKII